MPANPTYPGVYLEETPSNAFTVVPVPTAVTAFIGRTVLGPENTPVTCSDFGEFTRFFGGLQTGMPLGYAVEDFFMNGGAEAVIVRVRGAKKPADPPPGRTGPQPARGTAPATSGEPPADAPAERKDDGSSSRSLTTGGAGNAPAAPAAGSQGALALGGLSLTAATSGDWSRLLTATIDKVGLPENVVTRSGGTKDDTFNLTLVYSPPRVPPTIERFAMLTTADTSRNVARVLAAESQLARVKAPDGAVTYGAAVSEAAATVFTAGETDLPLTAAQIADPELKKSRTGVYALDKIDLFNILCIPPEDGAADADLKTLHGEAAAYCAERRAVYVVDAPKGWAALAETGRLGEVDPGADLGITAADQQQCTAVYFPRIKRADPGQAGLPVDMSCVGVVAGQMARNDLTRGVWKAPAGVGAAMGGVLGLEVVLTDAQQGQLNPIGVNCLRSFRVLGPLVWGARTLRGADLMSDDFKYLPVRRLTHFIEESLLRTLKRAVFEPNDEALWSQIRLMANVFMADLARQGAFYSYQVSCDAKTTTPYHIDRGICVVQVAFAPVKPAEFIVLTIQQQQQAGLAAA